MQRLAQAVRPGRLAGKACGVLPAGRPAVADVLPRPDPERKVGLDYDHDWSRRYPVRLARAVMMDNVARPTARLVAPATLRGLEHLQYVERPVIFAADHASHIDTPLLLTNLPVAFRHKTVVAAASDYFFDRTWKSILWSFALAAIPIERSKVNRRSADTAAALIEDGWSLVIFPEGGRSPDGWTQPSGRCRLPGSPHRPPGGPRLPPRHPARAAQDRLLIGRPAPRWLGHRVAGVGGCAAPPSLCSSARPCAPSPTRARTASPNEWRRPWPRWRARSTPTGGRRAAR